MSETFAIGFWFHKNHTQLKGQQNVVNLSHKCSILAHNCVIIRAFCAIIRANLLTFHFIPGKFGANNRALLY